MGTEVGQHQGAQQSIGNTIGPPQGNEEQRGDAENGGHGKVGRIAGKPGAFEADMCIFHSMDSPKTGIEGTAALQ